MSDFSIRLSLTLRGHGSQDRVVDCALELQEPSHTGSEVNTGSGSTSDAAVSQRGVEQDVQGQAGDTAVKSCRSNAIKEDDGRGEGALNSGQRNYIRHQYLGEIGVQQINAASQANLAAAQTQADSANAMVKQLLSGAVKNSSGAA